MSLTDRLIKNTENIRKNNAKDPYYEDEEYYSYMNKERDLSYINDRKDTFHKRPDDLAINRMESVFDRTAVFRTKTDR